MKVLEKTQTIVRYQHYNGIVCYGVVEGEEILQLACSFIDITNDNLKYDGTKLRYNDVKILEPVSPSKVINFGWTYAEHAKETGGEANLTEPLLFLKPMSSLIPTQEAIVLPPSNLTMEVEMEGEVAIVIGKYGKNIAMDKAMEYVLGCTIFNDITARDLTRCDPQFTRGKGFDTFGPLGPYIVKGVDPTDLTVTTSLNDKIVQEGSTHKMSFSIPFLISWVSQIMTLKPGDVLATGSPSGSSPMKSGDNVAVCVDQIGKLNNFVK